MNKTDIGILAVSALVIFLLLKKFGGLRPAVAAAPGSGGVDYSGVFLPGWIPNSAVGAPDAYRSDYAESPDYDAIDRILKNGGRVMV